jgi:hypothetical protein
MLYVSVAACHAQLVACLLLRCNLPACLHYSSTLDKAPHSALHICSRTILLCSFSVFNSNTYTPLDTTADWVLAKAAFNSLDTAVHAVVHFLNGETVCYCCCSALCIAAACACIVLHHLSATRPSS